MGYFGVIGEGNDTDFTSVHLFPNPMLYWFGLSSVDFIRKFLMATKLCFTRTADFTYFFMFCCLWLFWQFIAVDFSFSISVPIPLSTIIWFCIFGAGIFCISLLDNNKGQNRLFLQLLLL